MNVLNRNKQIYSKNHLTRANNLLKSASCYAVAIYTPLLDKNPKMRSIVDSDLLEFWDYLVTIACIGTAFLEIADTVPKKEQPGISHAIQKELNDWQQNSYKALVSFIDYSLQATEYKGIEITDAIGGWVWVNMEKHEHSNQQLRELATSLELVKEVGFLILSAFHNWWREN